MIVYILVAMCSYQPHFTAPTTVKVSTVIFTKADQCIRNVAENKKVLTACNRGLYIECHEKSVEK